MIIFYGIILVNNNNSEVSDRDYLRQLISTVHPRKPFPVMWIRIDSELISKHHLEVKKLLIFKSEPKPNLREIRTYSPKNVISCAKFLLLLKLCLSLHFISLDPDPQHCILLLKVKKSDMRTKLVREISSRYI